MDLEMTREGMAMFFGAILLITTGVQLLWWYFSPQRTRTFIGRFSRGEQLIVIPTCIVLFLFGVVLFSVGFFKL